MTGNESEQQGPQPRRPLLFVKAEKGTGGSPPSPKHLLSMGDSASSNVSERGGWLLETSVLEAEAAEGMLK